MNEIPERPSKAQELRAFLLLAVLMGPVLAVIVVGGYGFLVWMFQLLAGPPGPRAFGFGRQASSSASMSERRPSHSTRKQTASAADPSARAPRRRP